MKTETKRLVDWAKSLIKDYRVQNITSHTNFRARNVSAANHWESEIDNCEKFAEFLNSLPEIESHLCRGGYIQDKNGKPCCDGDQILNPSLLDGKKELGKLYWSVNDCCFYCKIDDKCYSLAVGYNGFEKVEE